MSHYRLAIFFQAEDGIRDTSVTGVQTCALPICRRSRCLRALGVRAALIAGGESHHSWFLPLPEWPGSFFANKPGSSAAACGSHSCFSRLLDCDELRIWRRDAVIERHEDLRLRCNSCTRAMSCAARCTSFAFSNQAKRRAFLQLQPPLQFKIGGRVFETRRLFSLSSSSTSSRSSLKSRMAI